MARGRPSRTTLYARLDSAIAELNNRLGGLPSPKESEYVWSDIWHLEAHHSTALEGNTLVLREVEVLLDKGRAVGAKPLREYMEVPGYALISMHEVRQVHSLAMSPVWQVAPHPDATDREGSGMFREHDIQPFGAGMKPPSWRLVPARVQDWIDEANAAAGEIHGEGGVPFPEILARLHDGFEKVHPFIDGNGRTGRLLLNLLLVGMVIRRSSCLSSSGRPTLPPCSEPTTATTGRWEKTWPAPCTTTSTVSSFRPWQDRHGWFRCPPWSIRTCHCLPSGRQHRGASMLFRVRTACGAAAVRQWRSTGARGSVDEQPKLVVRLARGLSAAGERPEKGSGGAAQQRRSPESG